MSDDHGTFPILVRDITLSVPNLLLIDQSVHQGEFKCLLI
jgi:hypothetical protein